MPLRSDLQTAEPIRAATNDVSTFEESVPTPPGPLRTRGFRQETGSLSRRETEPGYVDAAVHLRAIVLAPRNHSTRAVFLLKIGP